MVNIEINGKALEVPEGTMLLEAADDAGITIPRFCYHSKLSLAASCRMCLVDVEKMPKPLPACATPVGEGMKVFTRSPKAIAAQRAVMEFLLINHPLDCPICDQGGECELQDVAVGFGSDTSEYLEEKRVVEDQDIGSLISTEMTRCIQCTRCVRFGQEIAGQMELGAPGRGEHMHIATYLRGSVSSELSGNVIDLCPVGALTSKPFRFHARSWELSHHDGVSMHDGLGTNLRVDVRRDEVMRVVPRENESINECWISDRDRFSYRALQHSGRLTQPQIKRNGEWQTVGWDDALTFAAESLQKIIKQHGAEKLGALVGGESTNEEYYLLQKFMRGVGSSNIDYRLKQGDLSDSASDPSFPSVGQAIADLEMNNAALLIGSDLRLELPLIAQRLRKAARHGARVSSIASIDVELYMKSSQSIVVAPDQIASTLAAVAKSLVALGVAAPLHCAAAIDAAQTDQQSEAIAKELKEGIATTVMVGAMAYAASNFAQIRQLAAAIAQMSDSKLALLDPAGNAVGATLAGAVPHRGVAGKEIVKGGLDWRAMMASNLKGLILLNSEPELDASDSGAALQGLENSGFVVALTAFESEQMRQSADVLLPIATIFESAGSAVNLEGTWQRFSAAVNPPGEARPAWKILRVMGNLFDINGFEQLSVDDVHAELQAECENVEYRSLNATQVASTAAAAGLLQRVATPSLYHNGPIVRRSDALQATESAANARKLRLNSATATKLGVADEGEVALKQGGFTRNVTIQLDDSVANDSFVLAVGTAESVGFGVDGNFEIGGV